MGDGGERAGSFLRSPRIALPLFFLKGFYFQPAANPVLPTAGAFLLFFWAEGSLDRLHLALLLYLFVPAHLRIVDPFGGRRGEGAPVRRLFRSLPVPPELLLRSYLAATLLYAFAVWGLIAFGVDRLSRPPDWTSLQKISAAGPSGDTIESWVGFAQNARGVYRFATEIIDRSFLYDAAAGLGGAPPLLSALFFAAFLQATLFRIDRSLRREGGLRGSLVHSLPIVLYILLGAVFLAEVSLDRAETAAWVRVLLARPDAVRASLAALLVATLLSAAHLHRSIRSDLREEES